MIILLKYTYMMETEKIQEELESLWKKYIEILENTNSSWEKLNEARAILYLIGNFYLEKVAVEAMEKRLPFLKEKLSILEFLDTIDKKSSKSF